MLAAAPPTESDDAQRAQLRRLRRVEYLQTKSRWWTHDTRTLKAALLDWALVGSQAPLTKAWRAHRRRVVADLVRLAFVGTRLKPTVAGARSLLIPLPDDERKKQRENAMSLGKLTM